jgi:hypothetical protein
MKLIAIILLLTTTSPFIHYSLAQQPGYEFILISETGLKDLKQRYLAGHSDARRTIEKIKTDAREALNNPLYSVTFLKDSVAPSGDKKDYISMGPYWWPDPSKSDGKPYIRKDGETNPLINKLKDRQQMHGMANDVQRLALGFYFTGDETYAAKAFRLLKTWFADKTTRMNPHLDYGQGIPGITIGRGIGIIETRILTNIPDALAMLRDSKVFNNGIANAVRDWYAAYTKWLISSRNGRDEQLAKNNHGTYYDVQVVDFALFTGDTSLAAKIIRNYTFKRIDTQFTIQGEQPLELERTRSRSYSSMNLLGWNLLATLAKKTGSDIWHYESPERKSLYKTLIWFAPYLLENRKWERSQITSYSDDAVLMVYRLAKENYADPVFQQVRQKFTDYDWNKLW